MGLMSLSRGSAERHSHVALHLAWWKLSISFGAALIMTPLALVVIATFAMTSALVLLPVLPMLLIPGGATARQPPSAWPPVDGPRPLRPSVARGPRVQPRPFVHIAEDRHEPEHAT
jgi:hypothetical protein